MPKLNPLEDLQQEEAVLLTMQVLNSNNTQSNDKD